MKDAEFLFPYQGKICSIANEACPYILYCTDCDLYNSLARVKKLANTKQYDKDIEQNGAKFQVNAS